MLHFSILGPIEVHGDGGEIKLGGQQQRSLLALLLLNRNRVVATEILIDKLWGERPPRTATTSLQNGISQLRRLLGAEILETRSPGYVLHVAPDQLDLDRFERLRERARTEKPSDRAQTLREALDLWRGEPFADLAYEPGVEDAIRHLTELRLETIEERIGADLTIGSHAEVVSELERLVVNHGDREKLVGHLMLALHRSGRHAEANEAFHRYRAALDEEGLLPGQKIQELHRAMLRHDPALLPIADEGSHAHADRYSQVMRALLAAQLVPVLGPQTATGAPADAPPDPAAAANHLARAFNCPPDRARGLARVSQYVAVTAGIGPLYDELHKLYDRHYPPGPVHRALAALPRYLRTRGLPLQLIVTTSYDRTLERAFADAGEEIDVVSYVALGRSRGKFLHQAPDGSTRVIDEPNLEVGLTTAERTIVLKIHGGTVEAPGADFDSYVVSEDDYIDYLSDTRLSALLPVGLAARLSRSHFLFLGYDLDDWSLRVFLRRLWGEERVGYRSWAVDSAADPVAAAYWTLCGVDVFDVPLGDYVEGLLRELASEPAGEVVA